MTVTVITDHATSELDRAIIEDGALWLAGDDLERATGWTIKPEGLCRGPICVPIPAGKAETFVRKDAVNVTAFWQRLDKPVVHSDQGHVWVLGEGAMDRISALQSLEAPDFELPDLSGELVSLSRFRGKKVLLASWASW